MSDRRREPKGLPTGGRFARGAAGHVGYDEAVAMARDLTSSLA